MKDWAKVLLVLFLALNWIGFMLLMYYSESEYPIEDYSCAELQEGKELLAKKNIQKTLYYSNSTISKEIIKRCLDYGTER